ncbi:MAG: type II toxin-antitoxin system RelE/ParE family toxin [bacterium]|nr:type II toxin-antitoxin system RelE/ParE family toxin [bacterium]
MARVIWSPQALDDIEAIRAFIARDAPRTAKRFVQRIFETVGRLERFPLAGPPVPELGSVEFREIRLKKYRIIYRVLEPEAVEIVTVYHGSRLLDLALFGRQSD